MSFDPSSTMPPAKRTYAARARARVVGDVSGGGAAVLSIITTRAPAETEMDHVGHWLNQLGPKLEPTRAAPDLTKCEGGGNLVECKQRLLDDQLGSLQNVRLFLDQNPAPKCLHDTEVRIRQVIAMMEISFEFCPQ